MHPNQHRSMPRKKMICPRGRTLNMWSRIKLNRVYGSQNPHYRNEEPMNSFQKQIKTLSGFNYWNSYGCDWIQISQSRKVSVSFAKVSKAFKIWKQLWEQSWWTESFKVDTFVFSRFYPIKMEIIGENFYRKSCKTNIATLRHTVPEKKI